MFVGATPSGALNRCRVYLPARPIWGSLTAELARREADGDPPYRAGDGLCWVREGSDDSVTDRCFRRRLLWTRPGAAIDPDTDSALDGSLRETECVQSRWRDHDGSPGDPVAMVGYVAYDGHLDLRDRIAEIGLLFSVEILDMDLAGLIRRLWRPLVCFSDRPSILKVINPAWLRTVYSLMPTLKTTLLYPAIRRSPPGGARPTQSQTDGRVRYLGNQVRSRRTSGPGRG